MQITGQAYRAPSKKRAPNDSTNPSVFENSLQGWDFSDRATGQRFSEGRSNEVRVVLKTAESGSGLVEARAENLTETGFAFRAAEPFGIGEKLNCVITVGSRSGSSWTLIGAELEVTRIEVSQAGFRIRCDVSESKLLSEKDLPEWAAPYAGSLRQLLMAVGGIS